MTPPKDLRDLTKDWFVFLSTCRRQAVVLPPDVAWMRGKLNGLMADMERNAKHDPLLVEAMNQAKYPLVYLADEILLRSGWLGKTAWSSDLYERHIFGTTHAGVDFFERLEKVSVGERLDLIEIYFRSICLGFRGQHLRDRETLNTIRRDLFLRLPKERIEGQVCPEAYGSIDQRKFTKLPVVNAARVIIPLVALLIGVWLVGNIMATNRLEKIDSVSREYIGEEDD